MCLSFTFRCLFVFLEGGGGEGDPCVCFSVKMLDPRNLIKNMSCRCHRNWVGNGINSIVLDGRGYVIVSRRLTMKWIL